MYHYTWLTFFSYYCFACFLFCFGLCLCFSRVSIAETSTKLGCYSFKDGLELLASSLPSAHVHWFSTPVKISWGSSVAHHPSSAPCPHRLLSAVPPDLHVMLNSGHCHIGKRQGKEAGDPEVVRVCSAISPLANLWLYSHMESHAREANSLAYRRFGLEVTLVCPSQVADLKRCLKTDLKMF